MTPDSSVDSPLAALTGVEAERRLLGIVARLVTELHPGRAPGVTLTSSLARDLDLDSLARSELLLRVEAAFGVRLPDGTLGRAETPAELLIALHAAGPEAVQAIPAVSSPFLDEPAGDLTLPTAGIATLVDILRWRATHHPGREHVLFLASALRTESLTYGALLQRAETVAAGLVAAGLQPGEAVAIVLPTSLDFFVTFFAAQLAGGVPVPLYPPTSPSRLEEHLRRQLGIVDNCQAAVLVTVPEAKPLARLLEAQAEALRRVTTVSDLAAAGDGPPALPPPPAAGTLALLQYTSGSTGNPKGVALTHANLLANIRAWSVAAQLSAADVCVSWLPLYHDMGLIGTWLGSLYNAGRLVLMSPLDFLARPERWLWAIQQYRGTVTAAPNFAFELCLRRLASADLAGLDLSSWRLAANGAEPVSPETIERFCAGFARHGFRCEAMTPVYGLAESCVGLAVPVPGRGPRIDRVRREALAFDGEAVPAAQDDATALGFVACGRALPGHELRVVDTDDGELPERHIGHLQFRGPSATAGYHRNPEASRELFHGAWLDTGDLAYFADGELYLTGRVKDLIIRGGRNLYPYELEAAIGELPGVRRGCVAVFGAPDPVAATERLVAVVETRLADDDHVARHALHQRIQMLAQDRLDLTLDDVVLAPPGAVLKTSSGKLRRSEMKERFAAGTLGLARRSPWRQFLAVITDAAAGKCARTVKRIGRLLYAARFWGVAATLLLMVWPVLALLPETGLARSVARGAARLFLRLAGLPLAVEGMGWLDAGAARVIVCNHASYLDGVVLQAILPRPVRFVAKRELERSFFADRLLRGVGVEYVERFDTERSVEDAARCTARLGRGDTLLFFPEGTFTRAAGLRPFHLGAFMAAAATGVPVLPLAIRGTRTILRDESWWPQCAALAVCVGAPIAAQGRGWEDALRLRDASRAHLRAHCGEPELERS